MHKLVPLVIGIGLLGFSISLHFMVPMWVNIVGALSIVIGMIF